MLSSCLPPPQIPSTTNCRERRGGYAIVHGLVIDQLRVWLNGAVRVPWSFREVISTLAALRTVRIPNTSVVGMGQPLSRARSTAQSPAPSTFVSE